MKEKFSILVICLMFVAACNTTNPGPSVPVEEPEDKIVVVKKYKKPPNLIGYHARWFRYPVLGDLYFVEPNEVHMWKSSEKPNKGYWILSGRYSWKRGVVKPVETYQKPEIEGYVVLGFNYARIGDLYLKGTNEVHMWKSPNKSEKGYWILNEWDY